MSKKLYRVSIPIIAASGYRAVRVEARTAKEACRLAKAGEYDEIEYDDLKTIELGKPDPVNNCQELG